jgi:hypothetical protein
MHGSTSPAACFQDDKFDSTVLSEKIGVSKTTSSSPSSMPAAKSDTTGGKTVATTISLSPLSYLSTAAIYGMISGQSSRITPSPTSVGFNEASTTVTTFLATSGQTSARSYSNFVLIFQFKAQYQLSDITNDINTRMTMAVANLLQVSSTDVILSFAPTTLRQESYLRMQQDGVLVSVGLANFQGSITALTAMITQESINTRMAAESLKSVALLTPPEIPFTSQGIFPDAWNGI